MTEPTRMKGRAGQLWKDWSSRKKAGFEFSTLGTNTTKAMPDPQGEITPMRPTTTMNSKTDRPTQPDHVEHGAGMAQCSDPDVQRHRRGRGAPGPGSAYPESIKRPPRPAAPIALSTTKAPRPTGPDHQARSSCPSPRQDTGDPDSEEIEPTEHR